jgi:hypothetical protein
MSLQTSIKLIELLANRKLDRVDSAAIREFLSELQKELTEIKNQLPPKDQKIS